MAADSMTISFACPACGQPFAVPIIFAGRGATCVKCGTRVTVPDESSEPAEPIIAPPPRPPQKQTLEHLDPSSDEFDYGPNGTIYYKESPRDLEADDTYEDEPDLTPLDAEEGAKAGRNMTAGLLKAVPEPTIPMHMAEVDQMLRRALKRHEAAQQAIVQERERLTQQRQIVEAQLQAAQEDDSRRKSVAGGRPILWRKWRRWGYAMAAATYVVLVLTGRVGDWIVLSPSRDSIHIQGMQQRFIPIPEGGVMEVWTVRSTLLKPGDTPDAYVLAFCGNDQRAEYAASLALGRFPGQRVEIWAVNYPGFGATTGRATLDSLVPTSLLAFNTLKRGVAQDKPIYLMGQNLGAAVALAVASKREGFGIAGLVLYDPAPLRELLLQRYGWFNLWLVAGPVALKMPEDLDAIKVAGTVTVPAVFIIAGEDSTVPARYQQKVFDAYAGGNKKLVLAPNDAHDGLATDNSTRDATLSLFPPAPVTPKPPPATAPAGPATRPGVSGSLSQDIGR